MDAHEYEVIIEGLGEQIDTLREERDRLRAWLKERNARVDSLRAFHPTVVGLRARLALADALAKAVAARPKILADFPTVELALQAYQAKV